MGSPRVVFAIGDAVGGGASTAVFGQVTQDAEAIVYLGDCYPDGHLEDWTKLDRDYPAWVKPLLRPTPGNHDWPQRAEGYDPYFAYLGLPNQAHNYSFRVGAWKFIAFNSMAAGEPDPGPAQLDFVDAELDEPGTMKIVFCHHAPYSSDTSHGNNETVQPVLRLMEGRAILHMAGHSHGMEEFKPRNGITTIVQGAGGRALYTFDRRSDTAWFDNAHFGLCRLELHDDGGLIIEWLDQHGTQLNLTELVAQPPNVSNQLRSHALPTQKGWSWCHKCEGAFFSGSASQGRCPAGGAHDASQSGHYTMFLEDGSPGIQNGWRWCGKCQGMFFGDNRSQGVCPATGSHDAGQSSHYALALGDDVPGTQGGWRWCENCEGLFFSEHPAHGVCPRRGPHVITGSGQYGLPVEVAGL